MFPGITPVKRYCSFGTGMIFILLFLASCRSGQLTEQPVGGTEAREFARKLEESINKRNGQYMDESIQWEVFYNRMKAAPGTKNKNIDRNDFRMLVKNLRVGENLTRNLVPEASFKMLHAYKEDGRQHLLFRLFSEDFMNYYDYELTKVNGRVYISDMFVYKSGDRLSAIVQEMLLGAQKELKVADEKLKNAQQMLKSGKYKETIELVDGLPRDWKKIRVFQMIKLQAAASYDPDLFETILLDYTTTFPQAKKIDMMLIDSYFIQQKYDMAIQSVNKLDKQLGNDPVLDLQRGLIYFRAGKPDSAIFCLEQLVHNMPDFEYGCEQLVHVYELTGRKEKAVEVYNDFKDKNVFRSKTMQLLEESYPDLQ